MSKISASNIQLDPATLESFNGALRQVPGTDGGFIIESGVEHRLSSTTGIDGTALGQTTLYTASGNDYVITKALVRLTALAGFVDEGEASIGTGPPTYAELYPQTKMEGLESTNRVFIYSSVLGSNVIVTDGQSVIFDVDVPYNAATATLSVDLFGYFI